MLLHSRTRDLAIGLALLGGMLLATTASAGPITMDPDPASVRSVLGGEISITLDSGDTIDNVLTFTLQTVPRVLDLAAIVFDDAEVLGVEVLSDPDRILPLGIVDFPALDSVAGTLIDLRSGESSAQFAVTLGSTPTSARLLTLNGGFGGLGEIRSLEDVRDLSFIATETLTFSAPGSLPATPEPSAALLFACGIWIAQRRCRR
ncbi:MAG: hypothetical protein QNK03_00490 [Myxococcota bacterium]|nr:hypothetical protein [Myxococcota bacterium]